ncbi:MAG: hypothetical protein ACREHG_06545, partial [Candidatus Saccharimonadales bacterium]
MADKQAGNSKNVVAVIATIIILCIIGFLVWLIGWSNIVNGNNNTSSTSSQTPAATTAAEKSQIENTWKKFFNGATPVNQRAALLQ